jgi:hypothetical protein
VQVIFVRGGYSPLPLQYAHTTAGPVKETIPAPLHTGHFIPLLLGNIPLPEHKEHPKLSPSKISPVFRPNFVLPPLKSIVFHSITATFLA